VVVGGGGSCGGRGWHLCWPVGTGSARRPCTWGCGKGGYSGPALIYSTPGYFPRAAGVPSGRLGGRTRREEASLNWPALALLRLKEGTHPTALTPAPTGSASLGSTRAFSTQTRVTGLSSQTGATTARSRKRRGLSLVKAAPRPAGCRPRRRRRHAAGKNIPSPPMIV
jgi:hypothetical protein